MRLISWGLFFAIGLIIAAYGISTAMNYGKVTSPQTASVMVAGKAQEALNRARDSAAGGTTLVLASSEKGIEVEVYDGRPAPGSAVGAQPIETPDVLPPGVSVSAASNAGKIAAAAPIAIFFASDGSGEMAAWGKGTGTLTTEPTCPPSGTETLTFAEGSATSTLTLTCQTGLLQ